MKMSHRFFHHLLHAAAAFSLALGAAAQVPDRVAEQESMRNRPAAPSVPNLKQNRRPMPAPSSFDRKGETDTVRAQFSDPAKPGTLKLSVPWGDVRIEGTSANEVVVTSSLSRRKAKDEVDSDGFRRLDEDVSFELKERNNVMTLSLSGARHGMPNQNAEFTISVPRQTNVVVRTQMGGDVTIANIDGEVEVHSMNGEVHLADLGSSAVVNTMNGGVVASFRLAPSQPISITTMNGEIDLRLPVDTKANLRMRTHNGSVRTNFPEGALVSKSESTGSRHPGVRDATENAAHAVRLVRNAPRAAASDTAEEERATAPLPPVPPMAGGKTIVGTLNGGGVDISLSSMNGTITLRQAK